MNNFVHHNGFLLLYAFRSMATNPTLQEFELTAPCMGDRSQRGQLDFVTSEAY